MDNTTRNGRVSASPGSRHHKRPLKIKDEDEDEKPRLRKRLREVKGEDEEPGHHKRPRVAKDEDGEPNSILSNRNSRSGTPFPSPNLGLSDIIPDEEESTFHLPASLDRHACLRCLKFLASEPRFECKFQARSVKCTRCTRLSSKCEPVPICADAEARRLLVLQAEYDESLPREAEALRHCVVAAADELAVSVRLEAQRLPKSDREIKLALLRGQEEMIGLLRRIEANLAVPGQEKKTEGKGKGKGRT